MAEAIAQKEITQKAFKVFNDPIHGHIELHPLLVKIIDTPHFQRLRNIKQLGGGYYVFPGASHNRFEHCIGVCHLAGKLVKSLKTQKNLGITETDELCVQIAGLCHDLGHGPFSHLFEVFMNEPKMESKQPNQKWKHEEQACKMFDDLIKDKEVDKEIKKYGIISKITFIKELIRGKKDSTSFLFEIVNNAQNGIDVDKMDYFSRDCHHLGMTSNFSHERYMVFARVCTDDLFEHICMRDKEALNMYELFHVRDLLHRNAYQHRVVKAVELMILDAIREADGIFKFSDKVKDPKDYLKLTDNILQEILNTEMQNKGIQKAQEIIRRISERKLYRFIGEKTFQSDETENLSHLDNDDKCTEKLTIWLEKNDPTHKLIAADFKVKVIKFNYGMKDKNPVDSLLFYTKDNPNKPIKLPKDKVSCLLPERFAETKIMVFYTKDDDHCVTLTKKHISKFWEIVQNTDQTVCKL